MTLDDLYQDYENFLRRFARGLTRDGYRADDLVQETFIRAMGHLELLRLLNSRQQRAWLCRTLKNLFLDWERSRQREEAFLEEWANDPTQKRRAELKTNIFSPFDLAPKRYRDIVKMRYQLGMNSREIAEELGIPAATVRSRLHLAMKALRAQRWKLQE